MACRLATYNQSLQTLSRGLTSASQSSFRSTRTLPITPIKQLSITRSISTQTQRQEMDKDTATGQDTKPVEDWQKRPPYRIHDPNENFKVRYEASCHCGKVKYQLSREAPLDSKLCHCTTCQTQHGNFFLTVMIQALLTIS